MQRHTRKYGIHLLAFIPISVVVLTTGCDGLLGTVGDPGAAGTGGAAAVDSGPPPAPVVDAAEEKSIRPPSDAADPGGSGGATGTGGASGTGGSVGGLPYPTAPALTATTFAVGSVMPDLKFAREDGTPLSFSDIRSNKKNKLLVWSTGGDNCPPCVSAAKKDGIPSWKALAAQGLFVLESFNGEGFLVSKAPFVGWRMKTMWPMDADGIAVAAEPKVKPFYALGRIPAVNGIPWHYIIDLETMKVLGGDDASISVASLTTRLSALPARP